MQKKCVYFISDMNRHHIQKSNLIKVEVLVSLKLIWNTIETLYLKVLNVDKEKVRLK